MAAARTMLKPFPPCRRLQNAVSERPRRLGGQGWRHAAHRLLMMEQLVLRWSWHERQTPQETLPPASAAAGCGTLETSEKRPLRSWAPWETLASVSLHSLNKTSVYGVIGYPVRLAYTGVGPYTGTGYSGIYTGIFSDCGIWARRGVYGRGTLPSSGRVTRHGKPLVSKGCAQL
jgi:hypothetical protein